MNLKTELKLIKAMGDILSTADRPLIILPEDDLAVMDPANVCEFIAKTENGKRLLARFIESDADKVVIPNLDFKRDGIAVSKYSIEYLTKIMAMFNIMDQSVKLTMANDYPIIIENNDFKVILAPRISND